MQAHANPPPSVYMSGEQPASGPPVSIKQVSVPSPTYTRTKQSYRTEAAVSNETGSPHMVQGIPKILTTNPDKNKVLYPKQDKLLLPPQQSTKNSIRWSNPDRIGALILQQKSSIKPLPQNPLSTPTRYELEHGASMDFKRWLEQNQTRYNTAQAYYSYLQRHVSGEVPPAEQILRSARSWASCGHQPFETPPSELWHNLVPTLNLYNKLKRLGILPTTTIVRSVYRNSDLNRCAKGSAGSKHVLNAAIDIWMPNQTDQQRYQISQSLCQFWREQGEYYQFGLGLYKSGAIHIDTQKYRTWGGNHSAISSPCQ